MGRKNGIFAKTTSPRWLLVGPAARLRARAAEHAREARQGHCWSIGEALRASGVKREDVWITSKLASGTVNSYAKGIAAIDNILQEIGTSYLDLVLIHSPQQCTNQICGVPRWRGGVGLSESMRITG